jgi:hypothetical protein
VRDGSAYDYPLKIVPLETYGLITDKTAGAAIPTHLYYDKGYSATSTATLTLYPPPSAGLTLFIHSWKQMQSVSTMSETVMFPAGYRLMFESNFAIHLAAGFTEVSKEVAKIARESKAAVKAINLPDMVMRLEGGVRAGHTIDHGIYIDSEYIE